MDLIEALEQLTIHVKSREDPQTSINPAASSLPQQGWQYSPLDGCNSAVSYQPANADSVQLRHFENSIETLFTQINDLDHKPAAAASTTLLQLPIFRSPGDSTGSLEPASQEEDSDNSSQQSSSGYATSNNSIGNGGYCGQTTTTSPLVVSLMKRNLHNITQTVRKLGTLLSLGRQIELIYNQLGAKSVACSSGGDLPLLLANSQSICDSFLQLHASEPSFAHLQTIARHKEHCHLLLQQIHELSSSGLTSTAHVNEATTASANSSQDGDHEMSLDDGDDRDDREADAQDALDCALLECDQSQLDFNAWTDNRLYVNNNHHVTNHGSSRSR